MFECLLKAKLIEDRESSNYFSCGRTDKGVSALGQVNVLLTFLKRHHNIPVDIPIVLLITQYLD